VRDWYITEAVVDQWGALTGIDTETDGGFALSDEQLRAICETARLVPSQCNATTEQYRASWRLNGRQVRVELAVSTRPHRDHAIPQLVRVRIKQRGGQFPRAGRDKRRP
jgi:hypothetical protein